MTGHDVHPALLWFRPSLQWSLRTEASTPLFVNHNLVMHKSVSCPSWSALHLPLPYRECSESQPGHKRDAAIQAQQGQQSTEFSSSTWVASPQACTSQISANLRLCTEDDSLPSLPAHELISEGPEIISVVCHHSEMMALPEGVGRRDTASKYRRVLGTKSTVYDHLTTSQYDRSIDCRDTPSTR